MPNKKLTVKGNYRKHMADAISTQLATYDLEVVVAEVRPDYIRDAVQAKLPSHADAYESLQTCYPQHDTTKDTDEKTTVEVFSTATAGYGAPAADNEPREVGQSQGMAENAAEQGSEELRNARNEAAAHGETVANADPIPTPAAGDQVKVVDAIPPVNEIEPGATYEAPVSGDYTQAETITPEGTILPGEDELPPSPSL